MEPLIVTAIVLGALVVGLAVAVIVLGVKLARKVDKTAAKADNVEIIGGVRFTTNKRERAADGGVAVTHREGDVMLERGVTYTARAGGKLIPGKYTVLSNSEGTDAFNLRVGGFVREYKHASDLVLAEGEEICAVSHSVILR